MKLPVITTDRAIVDAVQGAVQALHHTNGESGRELVFEPLSIDNAEQAIEYINYEMPQLVMLSFSDACLDGFDVMARIVADPWLNNAGIVAVYNDSATGERINGLENTNILYSLRIAEIPAQLPKVLAVIRRNSQILFHRAIQKDLISDITGEFVLDLDLLIIPLYANLIANYLFNIGFVDHARRHHVSLILTEMLANAIEHGNCAISYHEKGSHLETGEPMQRLVEQKAQDPAIAARKVYFSYEIHHSHSRYVIRDEGQGFDWRQYVDPDREIDFLASHGRGIWMTLKQAAKVEFNEPGNQVAIEFAHNLNTSNVLPSAFKGNQIIVVEPEQVIFRQGEESDYLYVVADGEYRVEIDGQRVATVTPADLLMGEMSFLLQDVRSATVIANTPGRLITISQQSFVDSIKHQPYYGLFIAKLLAQRLLRSNRNIID